MISYTSENIATADQFPDFFRQKFSDHKWCFRGHADADWDLTSSLERYCNDFNFSLKDKAQDVEKFLIREFSRNVFAYASELPSISSSQDPPLQEVLALMQHHGAPTRLMDWNYSPFIATYFALEVDVHRADCCPIVG